MSAFRASVALLLITGLTALPTQAAPVPAAPPSLQDVLGLLHAKLLAGAPESAQNLSRPGSDLALHPLGDADGDGADDVLAIHRSFHPEDELERVGHVAAVSGRDLSKVLWGHDLKDGEREFPVGDVDGDGVADTLFLRDLGVDRGGVAVPAPLGSAYAGDNLHRFRQEYRSGRTGAALVGHDATLSSADADASVFPVLGFVHASRSSYTVDELVAMGEGMFSQVQVQADHAQALLLASLVFGWEAVARTHLQVSPPGGSGPSASGPLDDVLSMLALPLDGQPGDDVAVLVAQDPAPVYGTHSTYGVAATHRVEAWGSLGATLWSRSFGLEAALGRDVGLLPVGDVDGDGSSDLAFLQLLDGLDATASLEFLSGKDGATLAKATPKGDLVVPLPFGDLDGDGKAEMLLAFVNLATLNVKVGAAGLDLKPRWTLSLPEEAVLLNWSGASFTDLTGDGAPDLLLSDLDSLFRTRHSHTSSSDGTSRQSITRTPAVNLTLQVRDGVAGGEAWSLRQERVLAWNLLSDVSGRGGMDLFYAQAGDAAGPACFDLTNSTVGLHIVAGESGRDVVAHGARTPGSSNVPFTLYAAAVLGDLDGQGGSELGLKLSEGTRFPNGEAITRDNRDDAYRGWRGDPSVHWLILQTAPGAAPRAIEGNGTALIEQPVVPQGDTGTTEAPGPGPALLLAGLALAALALRRRSR